MTVRQIRTALQHADGPPPAQRLVPDDCPVTPLGKRENQYFYLNALGELVALDAQKHSRNYLASLFAPNLEYLRKTWPRLNKDGEPTGQFRPEAVADRLMEACARRGVWTPDQRVRGRGAWLGRDGDLILHLGDALWVRGRREPCGGRDDVVYPVMRKRPHPADEPQPGGDDGPAQELLDLLRTWQWRRPRLDPLLLTGWICAALVGGALDWRPAAWITGDKGTGKSTLQELVKRVLVDGEGIYSLADTTAAGIRQRVQQDTLPVALDEVESEEDNERVLDLVQLARLAASGGTILRGGQDHHGAEFTVRFATLYSSILMPPMKAQDLSRIAVLQLHPLDPGRRGIRLEPQRLASLGRRLLRRMADRWPALSQGERPTLELWRSALRAHGYDARGADQFGTLLACADAALYDDPPSEDTLAATCERLAASTHDERQDELADWQRCLGHLCSTVAANWRSGEQRMIGTLIAQAAGRPVTGESEPSQLERDHANDVLASYGVRVLVDDREVAIANDHAGLAGVYRDTHWSGRSGASGVWRQALMRVPGARPSPTSIRFRGPKTRAVLVPLDRVLGDD